MDVTCLSEAPRKFFYFWFHIITGYHSTPLTWRRIYSFCPLSTVDGKWAGEGFGTNKIGQWTVDSELTNYYLQSMLTIFLWLIFFAFSIVFQHSLSNCCLSETKTFFSWNFFSKSQKKFFQFFFFSIFFVLTDHLNSEYWRWQCSKKTF